MPADPATLSLALRATTALITTVSDVKDRIDRFENFKKTVKCMPLLRSSLRDLEEMLQQIERTYKRALTSFGASKSSVRRLQHQIDNCRRPCIEINELLISIGETRTTVFKTLKASDLERQLLDQHQLLRDAKADLGLAMQQISEERAQFRDSQTDLRRPSNNQHNEEEGIFHDWLDDIGGV